jgi:PPM family protein phosphatase
VPAKSGTRGNGRFAVASTLGLVRPHNEDRCAVVKARFGMTPSRDFNLGIVCDGLGGMEGGQEAASLGVATFVATLIQSMRPSPTDRLYDAITAANESIFRVLRGRGGTTLTAALITRHQGAYFCHVGDSRLYVFGPDRILQQITRDDTLGALLRKTVPDAHRDSRLLQFVGMGGEMEAQIDVLPRHQASFFLLTTDGAHDVATSTLARLVSNAVSPLDLSRKLIQLSEMIGGVDNATVVVIPSRIEEEPPLAESVDLTVMLPAEEVVIWLGSRQDFVSSSAPQGHSDAPAHASPPPPEAGSVASKTGGGAGKPRKGGTPTKTRKAKTVTKKKNPDTQLPLQPKAQDINVEFQNEPRGQD